MLGPFSATCILKANWKNIIYYNRVDYPIQRTAVTGSNQNKKRKSGPHCTTVLEDKYIRISSLRNSASEVLNWQLH